MSPLSIPEQPHANHCQDCDVSDELQELHIYFADYGCGAFIAVLCRQCDHRRWYRGQLEQRRRDIRSGTDARRSDLELDAAAQLDE